MSYTLRHWIRLCETTLTEMPITDLNVQNMEKPGSFLPIDRRLLQNPKHIERIRKSFALSDVNFNLYFINQPDVEYMREPTDRDDEIFGVDQDHIATKRYQEDFARWAGESDPTTLNAHLHTNVQTDPDAITVVYLSNANQDNSVAMTPWIVAHRFAHAVTDEPKKLSPEVAAALRKLPNSSAAIWGQNQAGKPVGIPLRKMMTMRSARIGKLVGDVREELIAQYIIKGTVSLAIPETWNLDADPYLTNSVKSAMRRMERDISTAIDSLLNACVGKMFIEV